MRAGQVGTRIDPNLPPGRHHLARTLKVLHGRMGTPTLAAAARLFQERGYKTDRDAISRYLNGKRVPTLNFVTLMHAMAVDRMGSAAAVGLTREDVVKAHKHAEKSLCKTCSTLHGDNSDLRRENLRLKDSEAGLSKALAKARRRAMSLPVPPARGDRQRQESDVAGARHIANSAGQLRDRGRADAALAMLVDTVGTLTPLEGAASLAVLRAQQQAQLADALVHMYGREHPERDVIRIALELHKHGMADDAVALLRSAVQ
ncbi:hypothetical protein OG883_26435 [Streptomyces sp. NBC_01142]|uniref:hypothetical protein n=1 Tax=Streptomyces sp. NBC_01142 TaxID=2975865 RepID=UPI002259653A|nr:hypothetical protein [Streptomyces sp. NBC_01142]MCX4823357.1 hypothetical protein [Streptomyces sp. NBC_01142]